MEIHIKVHGLVQGVFFRSETQKIAHKLNLTGWVKNMPDNTVEIVAEGPEEKLLKFKEWCGAGSKYAKVEKLDTSLRLTTGEFKNFEIKS